MVASNNEQEPMADADEQYVLIDKFQEQTIHDAEDVARDLKPLADLLKSSPGLLQALVEPSDYDLYRAIYEGRPGLVTQLVDQQRNVNFVNEHEHNTSCLHLAARASNSTLIQALLAGKPNLNPVNEHGVTPLMVAAIYGNVENIYALLNAGADTEIALNSDRLSLDALLDIDEALTTGSTAVFLAAQHGHVDAVKALVTYGANIHITTNHGFTPLHACAMNGSLPCTEAILEAACPMTLPDLLEAETDGQFTPLIYAAHHGNEDVAAILLDKGANIEHTKSLDMTPLLEACWTEEAGMVDFLINRGANFEAATDAFNEDIEHFTPLMLAAKFDLVEIASSLLAAGAERGSTSGLGETAVEIAEQNDSHGVLELLKKKD